MPDSENSTGQKIPMLREIIEERKGKAIETLSASYAKDRLPLEEYERLVEYINKIESERELAVVEKIVAQYGIDETASKTKEHYDDEDLDYGDTFHHANSPNRFDSSAGLTLLSSRSFSGPLRSGAAFVSILGSQQIKIRRCDLSGKRTDLDVVSILGETVILVEPGIQVTNRAIPILGGAWIDNKIYREYQDDGPELNISGAALLGNITVKLLKDK